jgi:excisionase family DNA binding protein
VELRIFPPPGKPPGGFFRPAGTLIKERRRPGLHKSPKDLRTVEATSDPSMPSASTGGQVSDAPASTRMTVPEIARRLNIGRLAVYEMLEKGMLPGIRVGRRWIITRYAYEQWERTCGMRG